MIPRIDIEIRIFYENVLLLYRKCKSQRQILLSDSIRYFDMRRGISFIDSKNQPIFRTVGSIHDIFSAMASINRIINFSPAVDVCLG